MIGCLLLFAIASGRPIQLRVDASQASRRVFRVEETLPATATVSYPKYLPGYHMPAGSIASVTGLKFEADGHPVKWARDDVDMFTFHLALQAGAKTLVAHFNVLREQGSPNMARVDWESFLFLPTRADTNTIFVHATLKVPAGWKAASPLNKVATSEDAFDYQTVNATELVDSPVQLGKYSSTYQLGSIAGAPVSFFLSANHQEDTVVPPAVVDGMKNLVEQAGLTYGGRHFRKYVFLVTANGTSGGGGLEHHECCEDGIAETGAQKRTETLGALMGHEFTHSWNGKYRRPIGLATKNYTDPMKDELLWVYEGLTEYLGDLLATRAGLVTPEGFRDTMASYAIDMQASVGRSWRPLVDTTRGLDEDPDGSEVWRADARGGDYYEGGALVWLEADVIIRSGTGGAKSLNDFLKIYVGGVGNPMVWPYDRDEILADLNKVYRYDWKKFFDQRIYDVDPAVPTGGFEKGGYEMVFNDKPMAGAWDGYEGDALLSRWGANVSDDGSVTNIALDSPAYLGGLAPGVKITQINGKPFSKTALHDLLVVPGMQTMQLTFEQSGFSSTGTVSFMGGPYEPHLQRVEGKPDVISKIVQPLKP